MNRTYRWTGLAGRIGAVSTVVAFTGIGLIALGVLVVARQIFDHLMIAAGNSASVAEAMFDHGVVTVLLLATLAALATSVVLSLFFAHQLARPLDQLARAARRIADGHYETVVPRGGPDEISSLSDSFNQMALSLREQEQERRELIANIAHELRTPLTNLEGYLEAMRDGVIKATPEQLASLHEEVERLVRLSRSLDTLTDDRHDGADGYSEIDLGQALRNAIEVARPGFEAKQISLHLRIPQKLRARAHPDHLAQILANLLQNASRYTPTGGRVSVGAEGRRSDVLVTFANTGDGIPDQDLPHVFERFYRVEKSRDAARGGAGIGLAIVKQLVEADGGEVGADSRKGHTRFWFRLPG